jgi:hypothetical protein
VHREGRLWHTLAPSPAPEPFPPGPVLPAGVVGLPHAAISFCDRLGSHHRGGGGRACAVRAARTAQLAIRAGVAVH